ncbi:MAG: AraC family transcriptional regulator [Clostridiales bacterium]|nr:AraC family transcriptional regulator [Clostridiales bacterium]
MAAKKMHNDPISFIWRQQINSTDFEAFYYRDINLGNIEPHKHNHYELYFFLEGNVKYAVGDQRCDLKPGDFIMIPPNTVHYPETIDEDYPYRRFVLWIHKDLMDLFASYSKSFSFGMDFTKNDSRYFYHLEYIQFNELFSNLLDLWQEYNDERVFKKETCVVHIMMILLKISRIIYEEQNEVASVPQKELYNMILDYINTNIAKPLTLDSIARHFFVSKYYVSHIFKDNLGVSLHQYIIKKRLNACRDAIAAGEPITSVAEKFGFPDYTGFYRAFKKEYGISPKEFRNQVLLK